MKWKKKKRMETERGEKNEREQYERTERKHLRLIIDHLSIVPSILGAYPSESLFGGICSRPLKTHPVVVEPSGASSWTASAGGTSAFSI